MGYSPWGLSVSLSLSLSLSHTHTHTHTQLWLVESSDVEPWIRSGRLTVLFKDFPLSWGVGRIDALTPHTVLQSTIHPS